MAETIKTIKASGGDYTSLLAWWTWAKDQTLDVAVAEVYSGFDADATVVDLQPGSGSRNAIVIRVPEGQRHNWNATGAYMSGAISAGMISTPVTVQWMRFVAPSVNRIEGSILFGTADVANTMTVEDCYFPSVGTNANCGINRWEIGDATITITRCRFTIQANLDINGLGSYGPSGSGAVDVQVSDGATVTLKVDSCQFTPSASDARSIELYGTNGTLNAEIIDNTFTTSSDDQCCLFFWPYPGEGEAMSLSLDPIAQRNTIIGQAIWARVVHYDVATYPGDATVSISSELPGQVYDWTQWGATWRLTGFALISLPDESDVWHESLDYGVGGVSRSASMRASDITNLTAANVKAGVSIDDVTGNYDPMALAEFPDPSEVWHDTGAYGPTGADFTPSKVGSSIPNLTAANVKAGVSIDDVDGELVGGSPGINRNPLITCGG